MTTNTSPLIIDAQPISLQRIAQLADSKVTIQLSRAQNYQDYINRGAEFVESLLHQQGQVYGVTTGYGDSCDVAMDKDSVEALSQYLYTFHGCGTGGFFSAAQGRLILGVRLASLAKGFSGVRFALLEQIEQLINHNIIPCIPKEGSVGASGDLTPLSYVAACLCGEREVYYQGNIVPTSEAMQQAGIAPIKLRPKEALAIMNGTAVMTALAVEAYQRAQYLAYLSSHITALSAIGLGANQDHFDEFLFSVKPHAGQQLCAALIRQLIHGNPFFSGRLQERYSIRCAPHVIGVLFDTLPLLQQFIDNEINSANDNPIVDSEGERILHGGHFYGGHIAFAMDSLKNIIANIADLLDRQMALLVDAKFNHGLPRNLSGEADSEKANHGLKAVQIAASAWTAEALKLTMPASVFSRSTESHNQDKVSLGTIAARDCLRVLELTEQVTAVMLMAAVQAVELRQISGELEIAQLSPAVQTSLGEVRKVFAFLGADTALDKTINDMVAMIQAQSFSLIIEDKQ